MMQNFRPSILGGGGLAFIPDVAGYATPMGFGFVDPSRAPLGYVPGGALRPARFKGADIRAVLLRAGYLVVAIQGDRAQNFFAKIRVPGLQGGAYLQSADAAFFNYVGGADDTIWTIPASGTPVSGKIRIV